MNTQTKKVYLLFMSIVLTLSLQSCLHDDKTTFDLPAAERIEKKVADYKALLESSEDGWVMQYYTGKNYSYGGYTLLLKFKNGHVTAMGDVKDVEAKATSGYDVVKDLGPTLSFNEYNAVIHPLAETWLGSPDGAQGDYEFSILRATNDSIFVRGRKWHNDMVLTRLPKGTNWEEYSSVRDIVGRVNPILIQKNQIHYNEVGIPGNPLSVHTSYFEKFSTLPSVLVAEIHSEPDLKKANNLQSSLNRIALRRKNLYSVIIWLIISSYAYYNSSRNGNGDMTIKLYDSFLDILTLIIAVLVGYYASIYIICNKFNFKFGFSPVKNKFSSYISGTMHYEWQFSPFSTVYKFILGSPVFLYSASLFIFSTNNIKGDRWYIIDIILFFVSLIYLLASIAIISGHTLYGIKYIIYGVISLFFLPIIGLVYIHIALIYFIILCFITTYVYLCWKKNYRFTKSSLSMH